MYVSGTFCGVKVFHPFWGQDDSSVSKVFAMQPQELSSDSQHPHKKPDAMASSSRFTDGGAET